MLIKGRGRANYLRSADEVTGDGKWAVELRCEGVKRVELFEDRSDAVHAKEVNDDYGCSPDCRRYHGIYEMRMHTGAAGRKQDA